MTKVNLAGCVILQGNAMLLLHRIKRDWYELPGGKIDEGEKPEATAIRELQEELGCTVKIIRKLGGKDFIENGEAKGYTWFLAEIEKDQPTICEPQTFDKFVYVPIQNLSKYQLSLNMQNFLSELQAGNISL